MCVGPPWHASILFSFFFYRLCCSTSSSEDRFPCIDEKPASFLKVTRTLLEMEPAFIPVIYGRNMSYCRMTGEERKVQNLCGNGDISCQTNGDILIFLTSHDAEQNLSALPLGNKLRNFEENPDSFLRVYDGEDETRVARTISIRLYIP